MECKRCNGDGREFSVLWEWTAQALSTRLVMATCRVCDGSGRIDTVDRLITNYQIIDGQFRFDLKPVLDEDQARCLAEELYWRNIDIPTFLREHQEQREEDEQ